MLDEQKAGVDREASELRASLRDVESARLQGRRDLHDARRQLRNMNAERCRLSAELGEMQVRSARHDELTDCVRRENTELRQQVRTVECAANFVVQLRVNGDIHCVSKKTRH